MTDKPIKFFFMASITAALQGKPQVKFNTISAVDSRNVTARVLDMIQQGAASMVQQQQVPFDDLVIENIFFLAECTEEEFTKNTQLAEQLANAANTAEAPAGPDTTADAEERIGTNNDLSNLDAQALEETPVDDVTTADVKPVE